MKNINNMENKIIPNDENICLSHKERLIFKYKGRWFYSSTGINSGMKGMVFPFYGIDTPTGWFVKPGGKKTKGGIGYNFISLVRDSVREESGPISPFDSDWYDFSDTIYGRFSKVEQLYTSYKYGHPFWENKYSKKLACLLNFDETKYSSEKLPSNIIDVKDPKLVNKWLKN